MGNNLVVGKSIKAPAITLLSLLSSTAQSPSPEKKTESESLSFHPPDTSLVQHRTKLARLLSFLSIMKLTALPLAFLPTLISAACYNSGESWNRDLAPSAVDNACKNLAGNYNLNESKVKKIEIKDQCYVFVLQRTSDGDDAVLRKITKAECKKGMNRELFGCEHGGASSYKNWIYKYVAGASFYY
ncbi:MAG: hypothetical protein Q9166_004681 [cf. Caloplaca sp. 2 TL-2023]